MMPPLPQPQPEFNGMSPAEKPRIVISRSKDVEGVLYKNLTLWTPETKEKPSTVLVQPFTHQFRPGNRVLLTGPSGCGKSTILRTKRNMWIEGSGEIIYGENIRLCIVPQRPHLPLRNLKGIVTYPAVDPEIYDDDRVIEVLHKVGLARVLAENDGRLKAKLHDNDLDGSSYINILSGGQQQRLMFARAIIMNANFIALDEATAALDKGSGPEMYETLLREISEDAIILSVAHRDDIAWLHNIHAEISNGVFSVRPLSLSENGNECRESLCPHCREPLP
ncbi:MAG: ATP-binding cassette domain-containing protein [Proteobacteria bacterium]|nr:ATP-binding cassette domain-containing protein [Pseudomonadota bacterium]